MFYVMTVCIKHMQYCSYLPSKVPITGSAVDEQTLNGTFEQRTNTCSEIQKFTLNHPFLFSPLKLTPDCV